MRYDYCFCRKNKPFFFCEIGFIDFFFVKLFIVLILIFGCDIRFHVIFWRKVFGNGNYEILEKEKWFMEGK